MNSSLKITQSSKSNFVSSFYFLSKEKREALSAIYAYCRLTDDIVDKVAEGGDLTVAKQELNQWREWTQRSFKETVENPVLNELSKVALKYDIAQKYILHLIDGVAMDLENKTYATFEELYPYCYGVASTVGLMCLPVFGAKSKLSLEYAVHLGVAFQLTNILRDVKSDAERGRIYIPLEDLKKFGFDAASWMALMKRKSSNGDLKNFKDLILFQGGIADSFYKKAEENLTSLDRKELLAPLMMTSIYYAILKKIRSNPFQILERKVELSKLEILFRLIGVWLGE